VNRVTQGALGVELRELADLLRHALAEIDADVPVAAARARELDDLPRASRSPRRRARVP